MSVKGETGRGVSNAWKKKHVNEETADTVWCIHIKCELETGKRCSGSKQMRAWVKPQQDKHS